MQTSAHRLRRAASTPALRVFSRFTLLVLLAALAAACGAAPPTWTWADAQPDAPQAACAQSFDVVCEVALLDARAAGDRARWGQALVGLAVAGRGEASAQAWALVKALHPGAWVPPAARAALDLSPAQAQPQVPPAEVVALGGADPSALGGRTVQPLAVPWPAGARAQGADGAALASAASMWAQAMGAHAALLPDGSLVPAAPLLERLWGAPLVGLPAAQSQAAMLVAEADRLLAAGDPTAALLRLDEASAALSADAAPCSARGALAYLRSRLASISDSARTPDLLKEAEALCADAAGLPADEQVVADYLRHLITLQGHFYGVASRAYWPAVWQTADGLDAQARALDALRPALPPRQAALLDALWQSAQVVIAHGQDTCKRHLPLDAATLDAPRDRLSALGREDLAQSLYGPQLSQYQAASFERASQWVAWARRWPWLEADLLGRGVAELGRQSWLVPLPHATKLACDALFAAQRHQVDLDRAPGSAQRHAQRWLWGLSWAPACGAQAVGDFGGHILSRARADGPDALLQQLSALFGGSEALQALMLNLGSLPSAAHAISQATKAARAAATGDDPDSLTARAALALLDVAAQEGRALLGGAPSEYDLGAVLHGIARQLADVPAPDATTATAGGAARYAPALRLCALSARALSAAFAAAPLPGSDPRADLDAFIRGDLAPLLAPFEATHHADALRALTLNVLALTRAAGDRAALAALAPALSAPPPAEVDALGLLLDVGQVALLEVHGALLYRAGDRASAQQSWDVAAARLPGLSARLVATFDLQGSGLPAFASLLPLAHHLILAASLAPDDGPLAAHIFSGPNIAHIRAALDDAERQLLASPDAAPMLLAVVRTARDTLTSPALTPAFDGDGPSLAALADIVARYADAPESTPPLRAALLTFAGMLRFTKDPAAATAHWEDTHRLLSASHSADFHPLLLPLLELSMLDVTDTPDPAQALRLLDNLLGAAPRCDRPDLVAFAALLPWRAHLLERLNRHADADATLQEYLTLSTNGFSGSAELSCHFESQHQSAVLAFDITANIGADLRPLAGKTAQVNLGFQTQPRSRDIIQCAIRPIFGSRPDVVLSATLARAAYAMRANDDATAAAALRDSVYIARALMFGTYNILGPVALPFATAREEANLALIRQVATFALARGHVSASVALHEIAQSLALYVPASLDEEPDDGTLAAPLRPFPDLQPLATFTPAYPDPADTPNTSTSSDTTDAPAPTPPAPIPTALTAAERQAWAKLPGALPWTATLAPAVTRWHPTHPNLHAALAAACPPKSKAAPCVALPQQPLPAAYYKTLLAVTSPPPTSPDPAAAPYPFSPADYRDLLTTLAAAPDPQGVALLSSLIPRLMQTFPPEQVLPLMDQTLQAIGHDTHPVEYATAVNALFSALPAPQSLDNFGDLMAFTADTLTDKVSADQALRLHLALFDYLGRLQRFDAMFARSEGLLHAASRLPGAESAALSLSVIHTLLRLNADQLPLPELDAWLTHWATTPLEPATLQRLQAVRAALPADPTQARNLASQIIRAFF